MAKFVLKNIEAVKGRLLFKQLVIIEDSQDAEAVQRSIDKAEKEGTDINEQSELEKYESSLQSKYKGAFDRIMGNMNRIANLEGLPKRNLKMLLLPKKQ